MSAAPRPRTQTNASGERVRRLARFGTHVELRVQAGPHHRVQAEQRLDRASALLAEFDRRLSRFDPASELCALNADPRSSVPASPMMQRFAEAVGWAGRQSDGLVDASVLAAVERAGYVESIDPSSLDAAGGRPLDAAPATAPFGGLGAAMHAGAPRGTGRSDDRATGTWRDVRAAGGSVERPTGLRLDSGGIGKGLAADLAADLLRGAPSWVVDCGGDLRLGGTAGIPRAVDITDPLDPSRVIHRLHVTRGGVATSGVTRRSWDLAGERRHHLIDPRTGHPADTGVLQVTALAPTALEAEVLAKTALLAGPELAHKRLPHGGVIIAASGLVTIVPPPRLARTPRRRRVRAAFHVPGRPTALHLVDLPR
ncbi:MAG: FAD:protein FMN transferase [Solirubrobacteraceae bacterium]|nr:FAD:protein FMN transferase [Solirubrobacteraceae bacterium]